MAKNLILGQALDRFTKIQAPKIFFMDFISTRC